MQFGSWGRAARKAPIFTSLGTDFVDGLVNFTMWISATIVCCTYSRVPNKRGGGNNRGGWKWFDIAIIGGFE